MGRFRPVLEKNHPQAQIFAAVPNKLRTEGKILKKGTIVDSTIINAPSSAKNREKSRDIVTITLLIFVELLIKIQC